MAVRRSKNYYERSEVPLSRLLGSHTGNRQNMQERRPPARIEDVSCCTHCFGTVFWTNPDDDLICARCGTMVNLS